MKKRVYTLLILPAVAIILEALPYGAVLNFQTEDGMVCRRTYSYFSLTPYGYANFGPLIAAVLTCIVLLLAVLLLIQQRKGLCMGMAVLSGLAGAASLLSHFMGFSFVGLLITLVLIGECAACAVLRSQLADRR